MVMSTVVTVGVLAIGVAVVAFTMVLRSERGARTVGHWADRLASPLTCRLGHGRTVDLTGKILDFRSGVVDSSTWTEALAAFSFARVASFVPVTPGGLGTVDAALASLLTGYGATSSQAEDRGGHDGRGPVGMPGGAEQRHPDRPNRPSQAAGWGGAAWRRTPAGLAVHLRPCAGA